MNRMRSILLAMVLLLFVGSAFAQETTGGIQGVVKDLSGAVVPNAKVVVTASTLVGSKEAQTDDAGYFRFVNLPPGAYTITISLKGFATAKRELTLEVGHLPSLDFVLQMGSSETVIEVTAEAAPIQIDVTMDVTRTNITKT